MTNLIKADEAINVECFTTKDKYGAFCALGLTTNKINFAQVVCKEIKENISKFTETVFYSNCFCFILNDNIISYNGEVAIEIKDITEPVYELLNAYIAYDFCISSNDNVDCLSYVNNYKTYLMTDSNTSYTKIGKSKNPTQRERTLQSEKPTITLFAVCESDIEANLHELYHDKKVRGEWYNLTEKEIKNICKMFGFKS